MIRYLMLMTLVIFFVSFFGGLKAAAAGDHQPQHVRQVITADSRTSRTISWQSKEFVPEPLVEYKPVNGKKILRRAGTVSSLQHNGETLFVYTVTLTDLQAAASYTYRVGTTAGWSDWYTLKTGKNDKCQALIFGDSQASDYRVWQTTASQAYQQNPAADFFINMGDLVDNGAAWYQWEQWFSGAQPLAQYIPAAPIAGNHEAYSLEWQFTTPDTYLGLFTLPDNGAAGLKGQSYSYDYGPVHFAVLDTQVVELQGFYPDLLERQAAWLKKDLAATDKTWKVVLLHRPAYGLLSGEAANDIGTIFMPVFEQYNVDVVLQGHMHCYSRSVPIRAGKAADKGPIYICTGRSGDDVWLENHRQTLDDVFIALPDQPNYLTLTADKKELSLDCFTQAGQLLDRLVLSRKVKPQHS